MSDATQAAAVPKRGFKPRDVEEPIDWFFHRPLASLLVRVLAPTRITPNQVSVLSGIVGLSTGGWAALSLTGSAAWMAVSGLFLLLAVVLDCADGQLARVRGESSLLGRALDGFLDFASPLSAFHGMAIFLVWRVGDSFAAVWTLGWATGLSLFWHAQQYDHVKNVYLHNTEPGFEDGKALIRPEDIEAERQRYAERGEWFNAMLMRLWLQWTQVQRVFHRADPGRGLPAARTAEERELYREVFAGHMRAWTFLGFGTHLFILEVSLWLAPWWPHGIWAGWALIGIPLNALCVWLLWRKRRLDALFEERLAALRASSSSP